MLIWAHLCMLIIKKDMLILGKGSTQGLVDTTLTADAEYPFSWTKQRKKFCFKPTLEWQKQLFICYWSKNI